MAQLVGVAGATLNAEQVVVPWVHYGTDPAEPIAVLPGDVAVLAWNGSTGTTWTPPGGWTLAAPEVIGSTGSHRSRVYVRALTGDEDPVELTADGINKMMGMIAVYRGIDPADIIDAINHRDETTSGGSHECPTIETVAAGAPVLTIIHERLSNSSENYTPPVDYVKRLQVAPVGGGGSVSGAIADDGLDVDRPGGTLVTPPPWTGGQTTNNVITWTLSLTPAQAAPIPTSGGTLTATASLDGTGTKTATGGGTLPASATGTGDGMKTATGGGTLPVVATLSGGGEPPDPPGPPAFPDAALPVDVDLKAGGTWIRVTPDVLRDDPITIERGRPDEASEATPSSLSLTLRNPGGRYSPRNPRSPLYGRIGRNTPIRVKVRHPDLPDADPYAYMPGVTGNYLRTPATAALDLVDAVDVRIEITPDTWRPSRSSAVLASKSDWTTGNDSWMLLLAAGTGVLRFRWTSEGFSGARSADSTVPVPIPDTGRLAVRAVFRAADPDHGGLRSYTFYTAPTIDGPWEPLGVPVVSGDGDHLIYVGDADLEIGSAGGGTQGLPSTRLFHGRVHAFRLVDGDGQTVADPGIADLDEGAREWTGPDGLDWSAVGATRILTGGPGVRFHGEVASWPPAWSLGGHHIEIPIEAAGILRRLGQGAPPIRSPLNRTLSAHREIVAYWPMEDGGGSFASAFPGTPPLLVTTGGETIRYGTDTEFPGSAPLATLGAGRAVAAVPPYPPGQTNQIHMLLHMQGEPEGPRQILRIVTTGTVARWDVWYSTSSQSLAMTAYDRQGNAVIPATVANIPAADIPLQVDVRLEEPSPGTVWMTVVGVPLGSDSTSQFTGDASGTVGRITQIIVGDPNDLGDTAVGHIALTTTPFVSAFTFQPEALGFPGEAAGLRLARLAAEHDVPLQIVGELADTTPMGPQRVDTLLALMQECEAADGGILGEARDEPGLLYRTRASLYNQRAALTLDYNGKGLAPPFEPTDDDQAIRNDITATRAGGSSARVVRETGPLSIQPPPDGVGIYDDSVTVNVERDEHLPDIAGWLVHLGTWDESRYPALGVKVHKAPSIEAAARLDLGDRAIVENLPPWLPPGPADALVQGYAETIEQHQWWIDCNASPAGPWRVWQLGVPGFDRLDTDGAELAEPVGEDDSTLIVATADGAAPWTTDPADFPLALLIGGERVTVTAITGETSPQTVTAVRAVNGVRKPHAAGTPVRIADPVVIAL